jgi:hypothetical protein
MTAPEMLRAAAATMTPERWCQCAYRRHDGEGGCALWHLDQQGVGRPVVLTAAKDAVYRAVVGGSLANFNDDPDTDVYDVRDLFERVADELEATCF